MNTFQSLETLQDSSTHTKCFVHSGVKIVEHLCIVSNACLLDKNKKAIILNFMYNVLTHTMQKLYIFIMTENKPK